MWVDCSILYHDRSSTCRCKVAVNCGDNIELQYCYMHLQAYCVCTSSDSVYPTVPVALVFNLIIYHNAVIMEPLPCFTVVCKLLVTTVLRQCSVWFVLV